jgi:hypothetical protein
MLPRSALFVTSIVLRSVSAALAGAGYPVGADLQRNRLVNDASCHINRLVGGVRNVRAEWPNVTRPSQASPPGEDYEHSCIVCSKSNIAEDMHIKRRDA